MSDTSPADVTPPPESGAGAAAQANLRSLVIVCYVLFLVACVNGVTAIIGVIIAYIKRHDAIGTIWRSHFDNLVLVFWLMLGGILLGMLAWPLTFGALFIPWHYFWPPFFALPLFFALLIFPLLALWYLYRVIRGLIRAGEDRPYRD
jgi:uncharacterized membrane protein